jgi:hypothetical protein
MTGHRRRGDEGDATTPGGNLRPGPFGPAAGFAKSSSGEAQPDSPITGRRLLLVPLAATGFVTDPEVIARLEALAMPGEDLLFKAPEAYAARCAFAGGSTTGSCSAVRSTFREVHRITQSVYVTFVNRVTYSLSEMPRTAWASVWVRAFFAYGISRSICHRSTLSAGHGL